jgi:hypothetical protein
LLTGNDPARAAGQTLRGQRVFCSNRGQRGGCGRTFAVFLAAVLPRHSFTATGLGSLLAALLTQASVRAAAHSLGLPWALESGYHLLARLRQRLDVLRSALRRCQKEPASAQADPLRHTIEHLQKVFASAPCPVSEFQLACQQPFLG